MTKPLFSTLYNLIAISALTMALAPNAFAAGTASGTDIINLATVAYDVGGVNQTDITSNNVSFTVDAKVDISVTATSGNVNVTPGAVHALGFTVRNDGNETFDFDLAFDTGTQHFAVDGTDGSTTLVIYIDNGDNIWNPASDTAVITSLDNLAPSATQLVWLAGTMPTTATNAQVSQFNLQATAKNENGSALVAATTDDPAVKEYVFADAAGTHAGDDPRDAKHSVAQSFIVSTAELTIAKLSSVIWDPVNEASDPLHIPGAIVEYTITVTNGGTGAEATAVSISDLIDSALAIPTDDARNFVAGSSIELTAPPSNTATNLTNASDADNGEFVGQNVLVNNITLQAGESATVKIRAEIQ